MKNRFYIFLTYLVLISLVVAGVSMSRYETTMTGSDIAVIGQAVIDYVPVSATLNGEPIPASGGINISDLSAGSVVVYKFDINNYKDGNLNQILLKYKISVSFNPDPKTIPLTYTLTPDDTYQSAGDGGWVLLGYSSEETHHYTLRIIWDGAEIDPAYLNQQQTVQLKINAEQTLN
ncbi:MAG TPA: hypothetical protein VM577_21080 [Anaerovoracaceae bacterium]|nr:hypothetical protein [Anaerovoracaceae bacterium]